MSDEGELQTTLSENSAFFSTEDKDPLLPNFSSKLTLFGLEEKRAKKKILSVFAGTEKGKEKTGKKKPVISPPSAFQHIVHIGFDAATNTFSGVPRQWCETLKSSEGAILEPKKDPSKLCWLF